MHVLFEEIHEDAKMTNSQLDGLDFSELAYADDTALITKNIRAMNSFWNLIGKCTKWYGLYFNRSKCVSIPFNSNARPKFLVGSRVPIEEKTKYSGGIIHSAHKVLDEIHSQIGSCIAILNRMFFFLGKIKLPCPFASCRFPMQLFVLNLSMAQTRCIFPLLWWVN